MSACLRAWVACGLAGANRGVHAQLCGGLDGPRQRREASVCGQGGSTVGPERHVAITTSTAIATATNATIATAAAFGRLRNRDAEVGLGQRRPFARRGDGSPR